MPRSLHIQPDRTLIRAGGRSRRHLRVEVVAPRRPPRVPLSLGLVLDRSGSMDGAKLDLAREGAIRAIRSLRTDDRLSVLAYSEGVSVLVRSGPADDTAKQVAERRLSQITAGGGTDLCGGWLRGCEQVGLGLEGGRLGRCLLLTDGLANQGITDRSTIVQHAAELRKRGVTTSTLGVGRDFDEVLLRQMAEAGGGNFYFAEGPAPLSDFIAGETGEALRVVAREAALVIDLPEGASVTSPNPFHIRSEQARSVLDLGNLVADQVLSLVLTVEFPGGEVGERARVQCWLWDADGVLEGSGEQEFRYAGREAYGAQPRDMDVAREAAAAYAALARRRAAELGREGEAGKGRAVLQKMATEIRQHAGGDPQLLALASTLEQEATRLEHMESLDYKRLEYLTFGTLRSRGEDGMTIGTMAFTMDRTLQIMQRAERHGALDAAFRVTAVTADKEGTRLVETAGRALIAAEPEAVGYAIVDGGARVLDPGPGAALSRDDELGLAYALAAAGETVKIAIVRGSLRDGASSHWYPAEKVAIVSLAGWDDAAGAPAEAFVAYEMVLEGSRHRRPGWDPIAAMHEDRRGCWGDAGTGRAEIGAKLEKGELCAECRRLYASAGVNVEQLLRLAGAVSDLASRPSAVPEPRPG
jgi:Ca-activated chloride channel family protein